MAYGKIEKGVLVYAPKNITVGGRTYIPGTEKAYIEAGYKPIEDVPYPTDGNVYEHSWKETKTKIKGVWTLTHELTPAERRELAYQTEKVCTYEEEEYTCDEMESLFYKYFAETGKEEKCADIKAVITAGKEHIREEYPDVVEAQ